MPFLLLNQTSQGKHTLNGHDTETSYEGKYVERKSHPTTV